MNRNQKVMFMRQSFSLPIFFTLSINTGWQILNGFHLRISVCNKEK